MIRLTVPEVRVAAPVRVSVPLCPLTVIVPVEPVETLALIATPLRLSRVIVPLPDMPRAEETVNRLPAVSVMLPDTSEIGPIVMVPIAVTVSDFEPRVMV